MQNHSDNLSSGGFVLVLFYTMINQSIPDTTLDLFRHIATARMSSQAMRLSALSTIEEHTENHFMI